MTRFRELTDKNIRRGSFTSVPDPIRSEANVGSGELGNDAEVVACPHASDGFVEGVVQPRSSSA